MPVFDDAQLKAMVSERHSVRKYSSGLNEEDKKKIGDAIAEINSETGLAFALVAGDPAGIQKFGMKGHFGGATDYIVLAGKESGTLEADCGYWGERLVLYAQSIGLSTCWAAMVNKKEVLKHVPEGMKYCIVVVIGHGAESGEAHKSKPAEKVSNLSADSPQWFRDGVEAAMKAPTAMNKQNFFFELKEDGKVLAKPSGGIFTEIDTGIAKADFELGAGKGNFSWA
ncbi:MAG: hypothetical protein A3Q59_07580 [Methanomethylophilus alvi]|nr:MAG: hypothetical protein A3Q59_07580 [Methanomethylophilus alvi]